MGWISRSSSLLLLLSLSSLSQASEVHTPHCLAGCPSGSPSTNDLIVRVNYTISSNDQTKFTDWAAYRVHHSMIGSGCKRKWRPDPELSSPETLEPADYKGAHATIGTDRGHQGNGLKVERWSTIFSASRLLRLAIGFMLGFE